MLTNVGIKFNELLNKKKINLFIYCKYEPFYFLLLWR